jgi:hypothetical protein
MRKLFTVGLAGAMTLGAVAPAIADPGAGPDSSNLQGICTAYFNGSDNGRAHKRQAPPFTNSEQNAVDYANEQGYEWAEGREDNPQDAMAFMCGATDAEGNPTDDGGLVGGNPSFDDPEPSNGNGGNPGNNNAGGNKE